MLATALHRRSLTPSASTASAVATMLVDERDADTRGVALPRPEVHLVARFGPATRNGLDAHAFGPRQKVHRKFIGTGQRSVSVRLHLGAHESVLGVPASEVSERIVALEDLWGNAVAGRLFDRLANARDMLEASAILEGAIAERLGGVARHRTNMQLALDAAKRLSHSNVSAVATALGVSERHLRRVFRDALGVNPKEFAQLGRFRRALRAARADERRNWASIATTAGYYDQAHLIADFRAISGVTPRALLDELATALSVG